ncbi:hypothetical protein OsJ_13814 [Oryza sativa Japonica Group]|uniref:Uncharacterized protein n=1 Tax=Oryza sativa subsp. japonica TaxID=39947 RepID=B9FDP1_ORYSJ|nr:hypothetical protein OsJ_13814 [Oryza sativa Japonica Group]
MASMNDQHGGATAHVLLVPLPAQGHMNPMLQFGRRLAYHGLRPTLVATRYVLSRSPPPGDPFRVAAFSDGFDAGGMASCPDPVEYCRRLEAVGSETLARVIDAKARAGRAATVLVYDPHMAWVPRVAPPAGVPTAASLSQPCPVGRNLRQSFGPPRSAADGGRGRPPGGEGCPGNKRGEILTSIRQFEDLLDADDVFVNSFNDLEPIEAEHMESTWRAKTVGPMLPSFFLDDGRLPANKNHGIDIFTGDAPCMEWLDKQAPCSVVLASYGTVYSLDGAELEELGNGLCNSGKPFLWVVRSSEAHKLSKELREKYKEKGLIVSWCPQLEVLKHKATAIATAVPMVAMPQSADQPTIAKYVETAWEIGVRARLDEKGFVTEEEVEISIKKVMDGERAAEYKRNAAKWMQKAKEAAQVGGSSDKNIAEFVAKYLSN